MVVELVSIAGIFHIEASLPQLQADICTPKLPATSRVLTPLLDWAKAAFTIPEASDVPLVLTIRAEQIELMLHDGVQGVRLSAGAWPPHSCCAEITP